MSERNATGGESDRLAPVIPLFGATEAPAPRAGGSSDGERHRTWRDEPQGSSRPRIGTGRSVMFVPDDDDESEDDAEEATDAAVTAGDAEAAAEKALLRKLRARSLSVQEARTVLGGHGLSREQVDDILAETIRLGYLDDRALADQLVHSGQDRKGQGRQAIAQTLSKRGVPRDVADAALAELPDDDMERALEFARRKAAGIGGRDAQAELRRLAGQLSRRGYPSNVALSAARQALDER